MTKVDDKFIYETEKDNSHNKLLKQIQGGVRLKPTQTNDRSKPILEGLRKFRRQMTIEEQLHKSLSKVNMLSEAPSSHALNSANSASATGAGSSRPSIVSTMSIDEESPDELDDIDKIRDDLQSTKQMLALELRNREAQERENKKLLAKIRTLETELEREKSREKNLEYGSNVIVATMDPTPTSEQAYVNSLKREVEDARKVSKEVEKNYHDTGELLVEAKTEIEEQKRQIQLLERKLAAALQVSDSPTLWRKCRGRAGVAQVAQHATRVVSCCCCQFKLVVAGVITHTCIHLFSAACAAASRATAQPECKEKNHLKNQLTKQSQLVAFALIVVLIVVVVVVAIVVCSSRCSRYDK